MTTKEQFEMIERRCKVAACAISKLGISISDFKGFQMENKMQDQIKELQEELEAKLDEVRKEFQAKLDALHKEEDWPKEGDYYFTVMDNGTIEDFPDFDPNIDTDFWRNSTNNCFRTKAEAEAHRERLLVRAELERLADGCEGCDELFFIGKDKRSRSILVYGTGVLNGTSLFASKQSAQHAISTIGEERLKKFMGIE